MLSWLESCCVSFFTDPLCQTIVCAAGTKRETWNIGEDLQVNEIVRLCKGIPTRLLHYAG